MGGDSINSKEYYDFISKFESRHTTDDCYTPPAIYDVVADYVTNKYGLNPENFVRPFVPNGDYQTFDYKPDAVVVDNPPFSILAEIEKFYAKRNVKFFLFAPTLTIFKSYFAEMGICAICAAACITYDNEVTVNTSFVTNLENNGYIAISEPDLYQSIHKANKIQTRMNKNQRPKYVYPNHVLTASMLNKLSKTGINYAVKSKDTNFVRELDSQREHGKVIFGNGFLLSEKAAAEKAAAEKAAAEKAAAEKAEVIRWTLSGREREIIRQLG